MGQTPKFHHEYPQIEVDLHFCGAWISMLHLQRGSGSNFGWDYEGGSIPFNHGGGDVQGVQRRDNEKEE